jgi:dethiobiotin synthetase
MIAENRSLFITATDTDVGKTLISGLLLQFLTNRSINCGYQKWTSSGNAEAPADLESCLQTAGITPDPELLDLQVPYRFDFPGSPHLAAELAGQEIDPERIIGAYREMCDRYEFLIVEGVGGLLVPLRRDLLLADLLTRLQIPTLIVARSSLGTLNHTLLTIEALRSRHIAIAGVVFTDGENDDNILVEDNIRTIAEIGQVEVLGRLPFCRDRQKLSGSFTPIGEKILKQIS